MTFPSPLATSPPRQPKQWASTEIIASQLKLMQTPTISHISRIEALLSDELSPYLPPPHLPLSPPRIEALLSDELSPPLPFCHDWSVRCDASGCTTTTNRGCLVVRLHDLFRCEI